MSEPLFDKVAVVGLGLIGSSIARGIEERGLAASIAGFDGSDDVRARARALGFCDLIADTPQDAVKDAELVVLAVPVGAMASAAKSIAPHLAGGAIVTDVGSVKAAVIRGVGDELPAHAVFVPGHPVAGTEHSGPEAGFADLFEGRWCVLTPCERSTEAAVGKVTALWTALGSTVETMTPEHHDIVLAITSHIPHLIAYNIVGTAADLEDVTQSEVIKFSAGGFRDFTRIAASDPVMWRDVFLNNKDAVLEVLGRFSEDLAALQRMIRWDDGQSLQDHFTRTRAIRRGIIDAGQDTPDADFGRPHGHED
ncbi:prephenate/arogenate dehydrogenase family protein [Methyloceanibacter sp.]|uniref:prephenate/arogenate dehydrogenase family protein n=1 Tax=Methyloceanibacter sp. TaxID=1965321 RepID=UPI002C285C6E|nr:prephenate/arogenate dehydrogenase family protein [Methyloceanibacter sp.]HML93131.1 prephenate/arogenate dehydrogenase family protein [Methyloceanibacter sp.]